MIFILLRGSSEATAKILDPNFPVVVGKTGRIVKFRRGWWRQVECFELAIVGTG